RDQYQPGYKFNEWEVLGVPVRVELGPKDLASKSCVLARRDLPGKEAKQMGVPLDAEPQRIVDLVHQMQTDLRERARRFRDANTQEANSWEEFQELFQGERAPGFVLAHWDGTRETEDRIAEQTKATIRCIPFDRPKEPGKC